MEQPSNSSLFGGLGSSNVQPQSNAQASTGTSLFGGLGGAGGGAGAGVGAGGASQPAGPFGSFGASILNNSTNQQQQQHQQQHNQQTQSGPVNSQPAYFNHLLERGKKRTNQDKDAQQLGELPTLQLGLGDIARKVRDLGHGSSASQTARGADSRGLVTRGWLMLVKSQIR